MNMSCEPGGCGCHDHQHDHDRHEPAQDAAPSALPSCCAVTVPVEKPSVTSERAADRAGPTVALVEA